MKAQGQLELLEIPRARYGAEVKPEPRGSIFSLAVCMWYVAQRRLEGRRIRTVRGYGKYLFKTGREDEAIAIEIALNPEYWPILLRLLCLDRRKTETEIPR
jgi:hypothetical protein